MRISRFLAILLITISLVLSACTPTESPTISPPTTPTPSQQDQTPATTPPAQPEPTTTPSPTATTPQELKVYYIDVGQVDQALESYRKALELSDEDYIVDDDFKDTVSSRIRIAEIEQKATLGYGEGHYKEAIECIDEFLTLNPKESKAYILRGLCNEARDDYNRAIRDYKSAFENGLPDDVRELLNRRLTFLSNPITILDRSKYLKLLTDDMPTESELGEQIDNEYYLGFRNIFDSNRKLQEVILKP